GGIPYYVAIKDAVHNTLIVAEGPYDRALFQNELVATGIHWVAGEEPKLPLKCVARIRYRQPLQACTVSRIMNHESRIMEREEIGSGSKIQNSNPMIHVAFTEPQRAVTPGQSIVFYQGEIMIGGGIIA
ncbi:MAG: tRNA 2-thiouridine(34) synthase MnmA, partial [bacterium]|nr:tRNA 2-thiouridine(34) synthase MnmA [bacterium]